MAENPWLDSLVSRGIISQDAAAQAAPYLDDARNFMGGGITGVMKGRGVQMPAWSDRIGDVLQNPDNQIVGPGELGVIWKGSQVAAFRDMLKAGKTPEEIGQALGITPDAARRLAKTEGVPAGGVTDVWSAPGSVDKLRNLIGQGMTVEEASKALGISSKTVARKMREIGVEPAQGPAWAGKIKRQSSE